jgi:hypothetical protein
LRLHGCKELIGGKTVQVEVNKPALDFLSKVEVACRLPDWRRDLPLRLDDQVAETLLTGLVRRSGELAQETAAQIVSQENEALGDLLRLVLFAMETDDRRAWETLPLLMLSTMMSRYPCPANRAYRWTWYSLTLSGNQHRPWNKRFVFSNPSVVNHAACLRKQASRTC